MTTRALVLGGGNIGRAVAFDLAGESGWRVTVADNSPTRLAALRSHAHVATTCVDLRDPSALQTLAAEHDVVAGALPSILGYAALRSVIRAGRPIVDVSFMPENALDLDAVARANGVAAVVDCGIAPGLSHMMVGDAASQLTACDRVRILVGGLPAVRSGPFEYKAAFSPWDVLEEYTRPARVVEQSKVVLRDSLSGVELVDVPGIGELEAFYTDGLRTLVNIGAADMAEKTLRYPGHARLMRAFRDAGFFSKTPVEVGGVSIRPIDLTASLMFPQWAYEEHEPDVTILRVEVDGRRGGAPASIRWDMIDRYDPGTRLRSMSRSTAFPAAIVARLVVSGAFPAGVHPPEAIGRLGLLDAVLRQLNARGVHCMRGGPTPIRTSA
jgi:saccharopine dehydrogenase-like NADP-dependent oxidoreductase